MLMTTVVMTTRFVDVTDMTAVAMTTVAQTRRQDLRVFRVNSDLGSQIKHILGGVRDSVLRQSIMKRRIIF